ncbi:MAG: oligosaccharide flippase family protein, partial [Deltaproteobacteria bacterium]|nr:oligosaccharide flippase family protein [Deltaproteobacteria bacterium]
YTLGLDGAAGRFYYDAERNPDEKRRLVGTLFLFHVGWLLVLLVAHELIGPWAYGHFFDQLPFAPYGRLVAIALVLNAVSAVPRAVWAAREDVSKLVQIRVAGALASAATLLVLLLATDAGPSAVLAAEVVAAATMAVPTVRFVVRTFGFAWDRRLLGSALAFSLPMVVHLTSHWMLNAADRFAIEDLLGRGDVGLYSAAYKAMLVCITLNLSLNAAYVPQFMRARQDPEQQVFLGRAMTTLLGLATVGAVAVAALGPSVVRTFYSGQFAAAADLLVMLAPGGVAQALYLIFVNDLFHSKRTAIIPVLTLASGLANVALCYLWIPPWGLEGAAWATSAGYLILALLVGIVSKLRGKLPWESARMVRLAAVALPTWALAWWLDGRLELVAEWGAKLGLLAVAALALWLSGFVVPSEKAQLRAMVVEKLQRLRRRG